MALAGGEWSHFPGLMGPMLAGLAVTAMVQGRGGLADLAARMVRWKVSPRWYAVTLVPAAVGLGTLVVLALLGETMPSLADLSYMAGLPSLGWLGVFALVLVVNGYGEEVGWRGLAWPYLRKRHNILRSALTLAPLWALWHLPTFWIIPDSPTSSR